MWRAVIAGLAALGLVAAACGDDDHYVYSARRYDALHACLDPYKSIDLIAGDAISSKCAPACFRLGNELYTSTVCPPLPTGATPIDGADPQCVAANALYQQTCGVDASALPADDDDDASDGAVALDAGDDRG